METSILLPGMRRCSAVNKTPDQKILADASIIGDRKTLKADSFIPATLAAIFLLLLVYFKSIGGYRALRIEDIK